MLFIKSFLRIDQIRALFCLLMGLFVFSACTGNQDKQPVNHTKTNNIVVNDTANSGGAIVDITSNSNGSTGRNDSNGDGYGIIDDRNSDNDNDDSKSEYISGHTATYQAGKTANDRSSPITNMSGGRDRKLDFEQSGAGLFFEQKTRLTSQSAGQTPNDEGELEPEKTDKIAQIDRVSQANDERQTEPLTEPHAEPHAEPQTGQHAEPQTEQQVESQVESQAVELSDEAIRALDNKKIGWGAKHNGNKQPEIPRSTWELFSKYNTIFMGNADDKVIYLTFDAGYENGYTESILDTLRDHNVRAAFFITGYYLKTNPQIVHRMLQENHLVGNHTDKHTSLPDDTVDKVRQELHDLSEAFLAETGQKMLYMRPPMGEYSERTLALTAKQGYQTVLWSFAYVDYDEANAMGTEAAYRKITDNLHNGEIMLLHTESKENAAILGRVIAYAKEMNFTFKSLDDFQ